jgi:hypothetical protein
MRTVHVRVGHNDDFMVTQLADVKVLVDTRTERRNHRRNRIVGQDFIKPGLFDVHDFAAQRQNGLVKRGTRHFGRTARGIAFD